MEFKKLKNTMIMELFETRNKINETIILFDNCENREELLNVILNNPIEEQTKSLNQKLKKSVEETKEENKKMVIEAMENIIKKIKNDKR